MARNIKPADLEGIGNFDGYTSKPRIVSPRGVAYVPGVAAVKTYSMLERASWRANVPLINGAVYNVLYSGLAEPKLGLGFAIMSEGILNVCMWGGEYPSLLTPNIFTFESGHGKLNNLKRGDIDKDGAFCRWEGALVGHESGAWGRYMLSGQTPQDKLIYLKDVFSGTIQDLPASFEGMNIWGLGFGSRAVRALSEDQTIRTAGDLIERVRKKPLYYIKGIGETTARRIRNVLRENWGVELTYHKWDGCEKTEQ